MSFTLGVLLMLAGSSPSGVTDKMGPGEIPDYLDNNHR